ncbi:hypothetical protein [Streptomyces sp900129855]|uniref:Uncharacterized protein n=1 Tax=Streptomyces sp. 900129855 TaxID=3155129 RepID=A0ABV2ZWB1_9ACTN
MPRPFRFGAGLSCPGPADEWRATGRRGHRHEAAGPPWGSPGERVAHLRCTVEELEPLRRTPVGRPYREAFAPVVAGLRAGDRPDSGIPRRGAPPVMGSPHV